MNFEFSDEQNLLREQAQSFLAKTCPLSAVRKVLDGKQPFDEATWRGMIQLGWTAPTDNGGAAITDYVVEYTTDGGTTWTTATDGVSPATTATVVGISIPRKLQTK